MDYMSIDNNPARESVIKPIAKFEIFTPDRLKTRWGEVIGSENNLVREKITKYGDEPPVNKKEELNNFGIIYEEDSAILHWRDSNDVFKRLPVNKNYFVGVEEDLSTGKRAVVLMNYKIDDEGKMKQIIRKYFKGE